MISCDFMCHPEHHQNIPKTVFCPIWNFFPICLPEILPFCFRNTAQTGCKNLDRAHEGFSCFSSLLLIILLLILQLILLAHTPPPLLLLLLLLLLMLLLLPLLLILVLLLFLLLLFLLFLFLALCLFLSCLHPPPLQ